jgi:hypothetical protein
LISRAFPGRPVTALARLDGTLFWAESTQGFAFSQIFSRPKSGGTPTRLVDTPGFEVTWLSADATHLYWLSGIIDALGVSTGRSQLLRLARP